MTDARSSRPAADPPPLMGRFGPGRNMGGTIEKPRDTRGTIRRIWGYLRRHRTSLIATAAMVIATSALGLVGPYLLGVAIDTFLLAGDLAGLAGICLLMLGAYAFTSLLTWLQAYVMAGVAQQSIRDIRSDLFDQLQQLPLRFFDSRPHGDLMSRLANDVDNVNQVLSDGVIQIVSGVLGMVGVAVLMLAINPPLALVTIMVTTIMTLGLNGWIAPRLRSGFRQQQAALGSLNGMIEETITGQRVIKAYHREPVVIEQFGSANQALRQAATRAQIFASFIGPMMNFINNLSLAVVAGVGGWMAVQELATIGMIASFITFSRYFGRPLSELANLYGTIQSAIAGAERVFAIIDEPAETDAPQAQPIGPLRGEVSFSAVDFGYLPGVPVLQQVSLHAAPGQTIALVGPTGAGKTTVINLLTRFYDVDGGQILIDGHDLRDLRRADLRRQLGIVLQDTFLFSTTVMENIRYGRPTAADDEVFAAARLANADQFIHRLPQGYQTPLSERGGNLSQGQRQLLAIARAILADPTILILDEATSSVDTRTERQIQEAMLRLMAGRTSFVIAHRLSTIREADQILVVNQGKIVERGTHTQLLAGGGFYAQLYAGQLEQLSGTA